MVRFACPRLALVFCAFLGACTSATNPSFPLSTEEAEVALRKMKANPVPQERPLVIVGGYGDPGFASGSIRDAIAPLFVEPRIVLVNLSDAHSFDEARQRVVDAVDVAFPEGGDGEWTVTVDVIGNSMGGLAARYATEPRAGSGEDARSMRAARLFTIGTPFRGAKMAELFGIDEFVRDMRPDSEFLARLDAGGAECHYELVPYARSDDAFVGAANASPQGVEVWWVRGEFLQSGHMTSFSDSRILADIGRRLRGEPPFTTEPRAPLPAE